jgi:hypothetical protein
MMRPRRWKRSFLQVRGPRGPPSAAFESVARLRYNTEMVKKRLLKAKSPPERRYRGANIPLRVIRAFARR